MDATEDIEPRRVFEEWMDVSRGRWKRDRTSECSPPADRQVPEWLGTARFDYCWHAAIVCCSK